MKFTIKNYLRFLNRPRPEFSTSLSMLIDIGPEIIRKANGYYEPIAPKKSCKSITIVTTTILMITNMRHA